MIDKIGAIVIRDRKLLAARGDGKDVFFIPGGKREPGESDEQTLRREVEEELGSKVKKFRFYKQFNTRNYNDTADLQVRAYFTELDGEPEPTSEISELMWVGRDSYDKDRLILGTALREIISSLMEDGFL